MAQTHLLTIREVKEKVLPVLIRSGVKRAGLFGSLVRGEAKAESDVDLLVDFEGPISLLDFVGLKQKLEETLGGKVDLVEYDAIKPLIGGKILKEEISILNK